MISHPNLIFAKPAPDEYPEWFAAEIEPVHYPELLSGLEDSFQKTITFLRALPEEKLLYRYQPEKWTILEMWQHVIDVERVLCYRALRYARQDVTVLHGFDEKSYAVHSKANQRSWDSILEEYSAQRSATILLFKSFDAEMAMSRGTAGRSQLTVRAVGYLVLGHEMHHLEIIGERYL
ncbi:MAG: DinB family protein [Saprospiraceae bacterium]|nr:DinB family protein [Saprospiraceae bacterium]